MQPPIPKSGRISIQFVGSHPLKGQAAALDGTFQQLQPDFWFCFRFRIGGNTASLALILMRFIKPGLRHEQLSFDQAVSFPAGVTQIDPVLAIGNLAHRSAVLCSYPHRAVPLFHDPKFVDECHAIRLSQCLCHQPLMNFEHRFGLPRALTDKVLQIAHVFAQSQRHLLNIFAHGLSQQASHVGFAVSQLFRSLKGRCKQGDVSSHFVHKLLDVLLTQIALWSWANIRYNFRWHGFLFSFPLAGGW